MHSLRDPCNKYHHTRHRLVLLKTDSGPFEILTLYTIGEMEFVSCILRSSLAQVPQLQSVPENLHNSIETQNRTAIPRIVDLVGERETHLLGEFQGYYITQLVTQPPSPQVALQAITSTSIQPSSVVTGTSSEPIESIDPPSASHPYRQYTSFHPYITSCPRLLTST